jgi:seryl-tRNA synthetase
MLDTKFILTEVELVRKALADKHAGNEHTDLDRFVKLDEQRRQAQTDRDKLLAEKNRISKQIGPLMGQVKKSSGVGLTQLEAQIAELQKQSRAQADRIQELELACASAEKEADEIRAWIPNVPHESVPPGEDGRANVTVHEKGAAPKFAFEPKPHDELGKRLGILDCERGAKVSGAGWYFLRGDGARLERALVSFFLDRHRTHGYVELFPPFCVTEKTLFGSGQIPKFVEQMYSIPEDRLYAIPTAEVPVTSYHRDEMLDEAELPKKYCAYSACFRREAGAAGAETRGILRVHQFNKVELLKLTTPETSFDELEKLTADAEALLEALGLRFRRIVLCRGDLGFSSAKTYDLEAWSPAAGKWLEVSSCSNFTEYQARRSNLRYKPAGGGKPRFVHTLNGSGLALPRIQVALWETCQQVDGSIVIPAVLRPYMGGQERIEAPKG